MPNKKTKRRTNNSSESHSAIGEQQIVTAVSGSNDGVEVSTLHGALLFIRVLWSTLGN
jgi:hypothetical protein